MSKTVIGYKNRCNKLETIDLMFDKNFLFFSLKKD